MWWQARPQFLSIFINPEMSVVLQHWCKLEVVTVRIKKNKPPLYHKTALQQYSNVSSPAQ